MTTKGVTVTDNGAAGTNSASGIYAGGATTVGNTIVAANRNNQTQPDVTGSQPFTSQGFNFIGNVGSATGFNQPNDQLGNSSTPINPLLKPLADNGGTTPTHALSVNSPAIDKGNSFGLTTDQRGQPRPFDNSSVLPATSGDNSDIGAFEAQAFPPFVVTKIEDTNDGACDMDCSLREAIAAASSSGDSITFASPFFDSPRVITLSETAGFRELTISKNLTISGKGANLLTIRRDTNSSVNFRIFTVNDNDNFVNFVLNGATISGGRVGGADGGGGGGIFAVNTTLTVNACHINNNEIINSGSFIGGGISSVQGNLNITNSTISNNRVTTGATDTGGGIYFFGSGQARITNSTISGNTVSGGATANNGGGIYGGGNLTTTGVTVTDNGAAGTNSASGIYSGGATALGNTIVAANRANQIQPDVDGSQPFASQGFNLIGSSPAGIGFTDGVNNDRVGTLSSPLNPLLDPLGNYGGTTPTHRLQSNSPAIDKGNSFGLTTDQRGSARTFDLMTVANAADGTDIGAYEFQTAPTAASVSVSGRVTTPDRRGLTNTRVVLTGANGNTRTVQTSSFGYYRFDDVAVGETYIISVVSRRYQFAPQVVSVNDELTGLDFTALTGGQTLPSDK